ncbi:zinc finger, c4 type (two domains) domain-containing protein [Ditylenchus destructor]|nr:zinc finger, c4 type (two domains) domain-containing protein [Ditylenchus destructor]
MSSPESSSTQCAVCNSPHHGMHFGVMACRACSSFFRRTIFERKTYNCRKNNNCDIFADGMRNACRACRLQHCLRAGMRVDTDKGKNGDKAPDLPTVPSLAQCSLSNSVPFINSVPTNQVVVDLTVDTPLLEHYKVGFRNFCSGQRSLFTIENPSTIFSAPQYKPLKVSECMRMDRGSVSLLHTMCINFFEPFNVLPHEKKMQILKQYWTYFEFMHGAYLTIEALPYIQKPNQSDSNNTPGGEKPVIDKLVTHYGYYLDIESVRHFFPEEEADIEKLRRYMEPWIEETFTWLTEYYHLNVTEIELVAMIAILFWNTVDKFELLSSEMQQKRDTVFVELNSILMRSLGGINGSIRLGQIVSFMHKTMASSVEWYESWTVAKIFLPQIRDVWDEDVCPIQAPTNNATGTNASDNEKTEKETN